MTSTTIDSNGKMRYDYKRSVFDQSWLNSAGLFTHCPYAKDNEVIRGNFIIDDLTKYSPDERTRTINIPGLHNGQLVLDGLDLHHGLGYGRFRIHSNAIYHSTLYNMIDGIVGMSRSLIPSMAVVRPMNIEIRLGGFLDNGFFPGRANMVEKWHRALELAGEGEEFTETFSIFRRLAVLPDTLPKQNPLLIRLHVYDFNRMFWEHVNHLHIFPDALGDPTEKYEAMMRETPNYHLWRSQYAVSSDLQELARQLLLLRRKTQTEAPVFDYPHYYHFEVKEHLEHIVNQYDQMMINHLAFMGSLPVPRAPRTPAG